MSSAITAPGSWPSKSCSPSGRVSSFAWRTTPPRSGSGTLKKRLFADLLDIDDPSDIGGPLVGIPERTFNFPLQSVESVTPIDAFTLLVGLDNNYPGGNGRIPGTPDNTELITLRSRQPLAALRVEPCKSAGEPTRTGHRDPVPGRACR